MRRLYLQIYLTFVGILLIFGVLVSIARFSGLQGPQTRRLLQAFAVISGELLPGPDRPEEELQTALNKYSQHLSTDLAVHDEDGSLLAAAGDSLPIPGPDRSVSRILHFGRSGLAAAIRLPDGRWLMARHRVHSGGHGLGWLRHPRK